MDTVVLWVIRVHQGSHYSQGHIRTARRHRGGPESPNGRIPETTVQSGGLCSVGPRVVPETTSRLSIGTPSLNPQTAIITHHTIFDCILFAESPSQLELWTHRTPSDLFGSVKGATTLLHFLESVHTAHKPPRPPWLPAPGTTLLTTPT